MSKESPGLKFSIQCLYLNDQNKVFTQNKKTKMYNILHLNIWNIVISTIRGLQERRNSMCVLDMDEKGDLYLYKAALLCKNEIIKRLTNGTYHVADPTTIGSLFTALRL